MGQSQDAVELLQNLTAVHCKLGSLETAKECLNRAWTVLDAAGLVKSPQAAGVLRHSGVLLVAGGELDEAISKYQHAMEMHMTAGTQQSAEAGRVSSLMGEALWHKRRLREAEQWFSKACAILSKELAGNEDASHAEN
eukprot:203724-Amphidinium_carterae.1